MLFILSRSCYWDVLSVILFLRKNANSNLNQRNVNLKKKAYKIISQIYIDVTLYLWFPFWWKTEDNLDLTHLWPPALFIPINLCKIKPSYTWQYLGGNVNIWFSVRFLLQCFLSIIIYHFAVITKYVADLITNKVTKITFYKGTIMQVFLVIVYFFL